jgi:galactokinase
VTDALERVYGSDATGLEAQLGRYTAALEAFGRLYGPGPASVFRAPGRVNLIGEHTDYSQGYVLPVALDCDVLLVARARTDRIVGLENAEPDFGPCEFELGASVPALEAGHWSNYARGAAQQLSRDHGIAHGMDALVCGRLPWGIPRGAGLSSSSALTVVAALALSELNGLELSRPVLAEACGRAEWYVGTRGVMDQFASLLSRRDTALFLDCRPARDTGEYTVRNVSIPEDWTVVVVDSGKRHNNTGPLFNTRVAEVRVGVALLRERYPEVAYLRDMEGIPWRDYEDLLPECISVAELERRGIPLPDLLIHGIIPADRDLYVRARCRHVESENRRVLEAVSALEAGDVALFGDLMAQAHRSVRDDFQVSTPELEALIDAANRLPGVFGARLTGAGWGGCIVALVDRSYAKAFVREIQRSYRGVTGLTPEAFVCKAGPGACRTIDTVLQEHT